MKTLKEAWKTFPHVTSWELTKMFLSITAAVCTTLIIYSIIKGV